jgi:adenylate cyclase class 2
MQTEVELKFRVTDLGTVREALAVAGAFLAHAEHRERNTVFDDPEGSLKSRGILLRVREYGDLVTLTVKEPLLPGGMKSRIEHQSNLDVPFEEAESMFLALGYLPVYRYGKEREIWNLAGTHVCLDTLPYGCFVEIEADSREKVLGCAEILGFKPEAGLSLSYAQLEKGLGFSNS